MLFFFLVSGRSVVKLCASTIEGTGLIPGQGTKILLPHGAAKKKKKSILVSSVLKYYLFLQVMKQIIFLSYVSND